MSFPSLNYLKIPRLMPLNWEWRRNTPHLFPGRHPLPSLTLVSTKVARYTISEGTWFLHHRSGRYWVLIISSTLSRLWYASLTGAVYSVRCSLGVLIPLEVGIDQQNIISWQTTNCLTSYLETEYSYLLKSIKPKWPHPLWTPGQSPMTCAQHTSHIQIRHLTWNRVFVDTKNKKEICIYTCILMTNIKYN